MTRIRSRRTLPAAERRGIIILLTAFLIIALLGVLAFSIDTGYMYTMQTQLDRSVDAAALAGAGVLTEGTDVASDKIVEYLVRNPVGSAQVVTNEDQLALAKLEFLQDHEDDLEITTGDWNSVTRSLDAPLQSPSAVRVSVTYPNMPLFFGRVLGRDKFTIRAESVATYQPRDIVLVLDLSGSMNDDSEMKSFGSVGQESVEANLEQIWQELGSPTYGNMGFTPVYLSSNDTWTIRTQLGLTSVAYPYPSGSWNDYINYVRNSSTLNNAGYRKKYGMMTLINYWLENKSAANQTPDLWEVSAQPITALKDSVDVFVDYLAAVYTNDNLALAVYDAADGEGKLEIGLTNNLASIASTARQRQAGHYHSYTNIAAGMKTARDELDNNARTNAFKMIVLLTDGNANWYNGGYNESAAYQEVLNEAAAAKARNYPILTISLGAGADTNLMQQVADVTEGIHYNVPGGRPVAEYREDLMEVFRQIAAHRPLKLVK